MRRGNDRNTLVMPHTDNEKLARDLEELNGVFREFRDSVHLEAERSKFFWISQRKTIMERLHIPKPLKHRRTLLWVPAAVAVMLCLFFFAENSKAPTPDLAGGYDQDLLVEVERALSRNCPDALTPAMLIIQEMEPDKTVAKNP